MYSSKLRVRDMRKVFELIKAYLLDTLRTPVGVIYGLLMVLGVLGLTGFVLNQGTTAQIIASYTVFVVSYASLSAVSYSITGEKEKGLYRMYRSSRMTKLEYITEKIVLASLSLVFALLVIVIGLFTSDIHLSVFLVPIILISLLAHAGIGLVFGSYLDTHSEIQKVMTLVIFGMAFLSPVFYTPDMLPVSIQYLQNIVPLTYSVEAMRTAMVNGSYSILRELLVLSLVAVSTLWFGYRKLEF